MNKFVLLTFQVVDLKMQLKQLEQLENKLRKEMGSEKAKVIIKEGVYLISIGSNDYGVALFSDPALFQSLSMEDYVGMVIGNITTVLQVLVAVLGESVPEQDVGWLLARIELIDEDVEAHRHAAALYASVADLQTPLIRAAPSPKLDRRLDGTAD